MKKIAIIVGTRPEAIKLMPVFLAFQKGKIFKVDLVSTGQHKEMLDQVFEIFKVKPSASLCLMSKNQTLNGLAGKLIQSLDTLMVEKQYEGVIVQGDTLTATIGAMVAFNSKVPVFHVEAGLRSYDLNHPFPEEANRRVIGVYASLNFTPTEAATIALLKENYKSNTVINVGNTVIDALFYTKKNIELNIKKYVAKFSNVITKDRKVILITAHRRENFGNGLLNICESIIELSNRFIDIDFVYPVHLNPNIQKTVNLLLNNIVNVKLIEPLPYDEMIYLMNESYLIISDSGGIQEEAPSLNKPVVVLREKTERMEGVNKGCSILVGTSKLKIIDTVSQLIIDKELYTKMSNTKNPYGDGNSSERIVKYVLKYYGLK